MTVANLARYAALLAAMFISFSTQQQLAVSHGVPEWPSYAVPVAIDLFLVWAVRSRRDIALAVSVAVSANVAGVLSSESLHAVGTWVSAALHAVFPLTVWRMHRPAKPRTPAEAPEGEPLAIPLPEPALALPVPAESLPDSWPDDDLWADFEAVSETATPPEPDEVRAVIAELKSTHGRATGQMLADHYGVSPRTGRRYLTLAG
ncbi:transfer protein spdA [Streptomyces sp. DT2A-34]|uniref:transfer protein spdA n=1 Tax=Streptomyces sp. DT2A-34 TaxID=3051182 RepID=UPI00265BE0AB|nr:transfer protein spdA [Streptomyces sp. DT2A-34]MDO0914192.1 transfer protein spdA [Streptomyces sp. DT2A-34]